MPSQAKERSLARTGGTGRGTLENMAGSSRPQFQPLGGLLFGEGIPEPQVGGIPAALHGTAFPEREVRRLGAARPEEREAPDLLGGRQPGQGRGGKGVRGAFA